MTRECWSREYWTARGVVPRWQLFGIYLALIVAMMIGFHSLEQESDDRKDQNCILFERSWQADVRNLNANYQYLSSLSHQQAGEPFNAALLKNLMVLENAEKANYPPAYCKGDVGLDDSKLIPPPKRPRELR